MDVDAYLRRINYGGPRDPTVETLRALHRAHMLTVPFENLNIHTGQPIVIEEEALFHKIVERRRGGFCYELNGLFAALLRALGFDVTLLSAGVARENGDFGPEFDHMALLVNVPGSQGLGVGGWGLGEGGRGDAKRPQRSDRRFQSSIPRPGGWLADVGFGDSFREPLRFGDPGEQLQDGRGYRLAHEDERWTLLQRDDAASWSAQYRFSIEPRQIGDYAAMCAYHQTSPASSFTQRRICSRATPEGRITLSDMRLIITAGSAKQERLLTDQQEYAAALHEHFGIDLDK